MSTEQPTQPVTISHDEAAKPKTLWNTGPFPIRYRTAGMTGFSGIAGSNLGLLAMIYYSGGSAYSSILAVGGVLLPGAMAVIQNQAVRTHAQKIKLSMPDGKAAFTLSDVVSSKLNILLGAGAVAGATALPAICRLGDLFVGINQEPQQAFLNASLLACGASAVVIRSAWRGLKAHISKIPAPQ